MKYIITILVTVSSLSFAESGVDCASIRDKGARLACFDRLFPIEPETTKPQSASPAPELPTTQAAEPEARNQIPVAADRTETSNSQTAATAPPVSSQATTATPAITAPPPEEKKESFTRKLITKTKRMFDRDTTQQFSATIEQVVNKDRKKMVFLLDNDQIWLQSSPRNLPIRQGDTVTIKSGFIGGYILRNDKGTSTRVERIR
jgi:hypothetical protein